MTEIIKAVIYRGRLKVEINYKTIWFSGFSLEFQVGETVVETLSLSKAMMRGGAENALFFELSATSLLESHAIVLKLKRKTKVLAETALHFRPSDRSNRPIVVSNKRPDGMRIRGWIVADADYEARISLFVDGRFVECVTPTTTRRDIARLYPETASNKNGFGAGIPEWCYDGQPHQFVFIEEHSMVIAENSALTLHPTELREGLMRRSHTLLKLLSNDLYEHEA